MGLKKYLGSFFSLKKVTYKYISWGAYWDSKTNFTKTTALGRRTRCYNVNIGRYSSIRGGGRAMNAIIGNYTVIAQGSEIGLGVHPTNYLSCHSIFYAHTPWGIHPEWKKPIESIDRISHIGNDVWIGAKSIIMDGVTIGDGAIVAAGSVVTRDVPPYSIVGGAPAKMIRYRYSQEIIDRLEEIKWWNLPDEEIGKRIDFWHIENLTLEDIDIFFPRDI